MAKAKGMMAAPEMDHDWRAESDCRTLAEGEDVRGDRKRFGAARKHAKKYTRKLARAVARPRTH